MDVDLFSLSSFLWKAARHGWAKRQLIACAWVGFRHGDRAIRVSCAHLIRLEYGNKYLLVRGRRIHHQMQPPGGVVKVFSDGETFLREIGAHRGDDYRFTEHDDRDLRVRVPGKHLIRFLDWYMGGKGRERTPAEREFREELLETGILPAEHFSNPRLQPLKRKIIGPRYSPHFSCTEVLIHEYFTLDGLTPEQAKALQELQTEEHSARSAPDDASFAWFTSQEIMAFGRIPDAEQQHWRVAEHAQSML